MLLVKFIIENENECSKFVFSQHIFSTLISHTSHVFFVCIKKYRTNQKEY